MGLTDQRVGSVLSGKYKIKSLIGKGGMGTVYLATHMSLGKPIAVKIFHPYLVENRMLSARFVKEARGTAVLHHRNIIDIIDIGLDEDHVPFFVMEYLKGESLKERLERKPDGLSVSESADIMIQLLTGLHVAHGNEVIHRDLKLLIDASADTGKPMEQPSTKKKGEAGKIAAPDKGKPPSLPPEKPDANSSDAKKETPRKIFKVFPE